MLFLFFLGLLPRHLDSDDDSDGHLGSIGHKSLLALWAGFSCERNLSRMGSYLSLSRGHFCISNHFCIFDLQMKFLTNDLSHVNEYFRDFLPKFHQHGLSCPMLWV